MDVAGQIINRSQHTCSLPVTGVEGDRACVGELTGELLHDGGDLPHELRDGDPLVVRFVVELRLLARLTYEDPSVRSHARVDHAHLFEWKDLARVSLCLARYLARARMISRTSGVIWTIFFTLVWSTSTDGSFFSVAITTPFLALMPSDVAPWFTALSACSICTSLPLGLKVVSENEY